MCLESSNEKYRNIFATGSFFSHLHCMYRTRSTSSPLAVSASSGSAEPDGDCRRHSHCESSRCYTGGTHSTPSQPPPHSHLFPPLGAFAPSRPCSNTMPNVHNVNLVHKVVRRAQPIGFNSWVAKPAPRHDL